ncbi:MAG TPA: isocitrate/isopropylmalate dehydrogenase family protein [Burkholderiales bacterium]|nr:isocitrate/isopropylmalate dehydrogenase family protein [Burkholderiales bacterium]
MKLLVLPGDGIGPEITAATLTVLKAADRLFKLNLSFEEQQVGLATLKSHGTTMPDGLLGHASEADGIILGPLDQMAYPAREKGGINVSAVFRVKLDLYANIRPARSRPGLGDGKPMDLVIVRECTEGFYADRNMHQGSGEFMPTPDVAMSMRKITAQACERIARRAFELSLKRKKMVTAVHKANVFRVTDGLFLDKVREVAAEFRGVKLEEILVDAMAARLVRDPGRFDVVLSTNMYADILSDLASELSGSLGLAGSVLAGDALCCAQAQHGSAPDIAGQDKANPTSLILSAAMLLEWLGEKRKAKGSGKAAEAITAAVDKVLADPKKRTADLGGKVGTRAFGEAVAKAL